MASSVVVFWSAVSFFSAFLSTVIITANENTTSYNENATAFSERNDTNDYTRTEPTEFISTTPTPNSSITDEPEEPNLSTGALPVSGHLPSPVINVQNLCPCDEQEDVCDVNCCCDPQCVEEVALFTGCSVDTIGGNNQLCSQDVASYSLVSTSDGYSKLKLSIQKETNSDIFCIQSQNGYDGLSHPLPALPTDDNFSSLFKRFTSFIFGSEEGSTQTSTADLQGSSGYKYGDVIMTAGEKGQRGFLQLPAPSVNSDCMDRNPAAFLRDQSSWCPRHVVLERDCSTLPALSMDTYTNIQLLTGKKSDAEVVPVKVASVVLQSVEGTQSELLISGGENLNATLLNPTLCANVVLKVDYVVKYNPVGDIVNATVSLVLGFVSEANLPLQQEFHITFVQDHVKEGGSRYSGNPGYIDGLPLVSGTSTADGIARSIDPRNTLSLLHSGADQDCLRGKHKRSPVLFGYNSVSGCTLRLEDITECSLVSQTLLDVLRGQNYPQYVASFGNSPLNNPMEWVQIKRNFNPEEALSCSIPLSLHLEIEWTKYGSLVNPQARIVSVKEVIQTNTTSLDPLPGRSSILPIMNSVTFISVSAAAVPAYRVRPTIDAELPYDFFTPFV